MLLSAAALAATLTLRDVTVVNETNTAIFTIRVGHSQDGTWGDDLLGFANVIDVSRGAVVHIPVDAAVCTYDVQATLRGGGVVLIPMVNLCTADRLEVKPSST